MASKNKARGYEIKKEETIMHQNVDLQMYFNQEMAREKERVRRKVIYAVAMLMVVYITAILVFHAVESWPWEDSIYFTTATMTTVGYGDLVPKTYFGRMFTIPLMWIGIGVGFYEIFTIQEYGRVKLDAVARRVDAHLRNVPKKK